MKKMIFLIVCLPICLFSSCNDKEEQEELGRKAAVEFCKCYENNSKSSCLDRMKSNYSESDYLSDHFIDAFNDESSCGIQLEKKYVSSRTAVKEIMIGVLE